MRFLVDESTGPAVSEWLRQQNHDVFCVFDQARGLNDDAIIAKALAENRILITNDKDFGEKVFREQHPHHGIIFLRLENERAVSKITALKQLFENYVHELPDQFVVVTELGVRFARS